jgi:hypothetical protein
VVGQTEPGYATVAIRLGANGSSAAGTSNARAGDTGSASDRFRTNRSSVTDADHRRSPPTTTATNGLGPNRSNARRHLSWPDAATTGSVRTDRSGSAMS